MPELSVVIPVHDRYDSMFCAVESALEQGVDDIEVLVVDDASTPSIQLPPRLAADPRVRIVRHSANRGAAAARNTGMALARGTWIAFLDSDDLWLPGTLAPRLAEAQRFAVAGGNPLAVHVAGFNLVPAGGRVGEVRIPVGSFDPLGFASGCWFSPGSTALFQREPVLARVGGQDETLRRFEDVDWFLRISLAGGGVTVSRIVAATVNLGSRPPATVVERSGLQLIEKYGRGVNEVSNRAKLVRRLRAWLAFERAAAFWYSGRRLRAMAELVYSWWLAPRIRLRLAEFWERRQAPAMPEVARSEFAEG